MAELADRDLVWRRTDPVALASACCAALPVETKLEPHVGIVVSPEKTHLLVHTLTEEHGLARGIVIRARVAKTLTGCGGERGVENSERRIGPIVIDVERCR